MHLPVISTTSAATNGVSGQPEGRVDVCSVGSNGPARPPELFTPILSSSSVRPKTETTGPKLPYGELTGYCDPLRRPVVAGPDLHRPLKIYAQASHA